ncbi:MAG: hypothetical protein FJX35_04020 [Alphaproteobacteria bacterium]|nr:hypothetical protein [Alphaproteobacteria bacterium]
MVSDDDPTHARELLAATEQKLRALADKFQSEAMAASAAELIRMEIRRLQDYRAYLLSVLQQK